MMSIQRQPLVSIVTPSYNQAQFIRQTIESVIYQDYPYIEYLIFDGGSTDGSVEIIRHYADRLAYWASEPDNGQADAINRGWRRSKGEIVAWLNSDDTYEPGAISAVVNAFRCHPQIDVVTADCQVIDESGAVVHTLPSGVFNVHAILAGNSLPQQGVFCRRRVVEAVGWLDIELDCVFDWALWLKLWLHGARFLHLPRTVANFRVWRQSKTASDTISASLSGGVRFARERLSVLTKLLSTPEVADNPERRQLFRTALLGNLLELALLHQLAEESQQASEYLERFVKETSIARQSLPYPQALAAHLAYLDKGIAQAIERFVSSLSFSMAQADHAVDVSKWIRILRAETYLVQAWHATHLSNDGLAARYFAQAIATNPEFLFQRRVLSPAVKALCKMLMTSGSHHSRPG